MMSLPTRLWSKGFVLIILINFLLFTSFFMTNPTLPLYLQELKASGTVIGLFGASMSLGSLLVRPIAGNALDRYGRKYIFIVGMILIGFVTYSYALVSLVVLLTLLRFVHGVLWGFASTACNTIATDAMPRTRIGQGMAYFGLSNALASATAPALGLMLMEHYGFHLADYSAVIILLVGIVLAILFPYTPEQIHAPKREKQRGPLLEPTALLAAILVGCLTVTMMAVTAFVTLFAHAQGIYSHIGLFFTCYAIGILLLRPLIGRIIERHGIRMTLFPCLVAMLIGLGVLGFANNLPLFLISAFVYGSGWGGTQTTLMSLAVIRAPRERYGAANGTYFIGFDIGMGTGSIIAGMLSDIVGYGTMYHLLMLLVIFAFILAYKYIPRKA